MKSLAALAIGAQLLYGIAALPTAAFAQSTETTVDSGTMTVQVTSEPVVAPDTAAPAAVVEPTGPNHLQNATVDAPVKVPGTFGLFWRNVRERVSLAATFNPVKKAEKELQFAEERIKLAKLMGEQSADPKVQAKAVDMMKRATDLVNTIEANKAKLQAQPADAATIQLFKNFATHQLNRETVVQQLQKQLPADRAAALVQDQKKQREEGEKLIKALDSPAIPQEVRDKVNELRTRALDQALKLGEQHIDIQQKLQDRMKELEKRVAEDSGDRFSTSTQGKIDEGEDDIPEGMRNPPPEQLRQEIQQKINAIDVKKIDLNPVAALKEAKRLKTLSEQKKVDLEKRVREMEGEDEPAPQRAPGAIQRQF